MKVCTSLLPSQSETRDGGSDVDLLVEFRPGEKSYRRFLDLADLLEQAPGVRIDLVTTEGLSPHIGPHIWPRPPMSFELPEVLRC